MSVLLDRNHRLLVVSPHLDDAILSAFSLLAGRRSSSVVTVFDGHPSAPVTTEWDALCGFGDSTTAMKARHLEDATAYAGLPVTRDYLQLLDTSYAGSSRRDEGAVVRDYIRNWVGQAPEPAFIAIPAGAGRSRETSAPTTSWRRRRRALLRAAGPLGRRLVAGRARRASRRAVSVAHQDHEYVRDEVLTLLPTPANATVVLYEELPYAWGQPADEAVRRVLSSSGFSAHAQVLPVDRERKASAIASYRSQLRALPAPRGRLDRAASLPELERFWIVEPAMTTPRQGQQPCAGSAPWGHPPPARPPT